MSTEIVRENSEHSDRRPLNHGIAIGPILFVIAILAVLATTIAAATGSFSGSTDSERAQIEATTIMNYANSIAAAVQRLQAMGCTDSQLSFYTTVYTTWNGTIMNTNPAGAPADKHCHIFDIAGGGITPIEMPNNTALGYAAGVSRPGTISFMSTQWTGAGTSANDIVMVLWNVKTDTCVRLNVLNTGSATGRAQSYVSSVAPSPTLAPSTMGACINVCGFTYGCAADTEYFRLLKVN